MPTNVPTGPNDSRQQPKAQPQGARPQQRPSAQAQRGARPSARPARTPQGGQTGAAQASNATTNAYAAGIAAGAAAAAKANKQQKGKSRTIAIGVGVAVVVIAIIVGLVIAFMPKQDFYDSNSLIGQAPYKSQEEIQAELDRIVEEGMLNISIASAIEFEDGTSEGIAYIENVPGNRYVMQVDIKLDDTGETVYQSGGLKPGNYIEKIRLSKDLNAGAYSATATFHALNQDDLKEIGSAAAKITLNVLN